MLICQRLISVDLWHVAVTIFCLKKLVFTILVQLTLKSRCALFSSFCTPFPCGSQTNRNMAESGPTACWMQYFAHILPEEHQLSLVTPETNLHYSMPFSGEHTSLFHLPPYWTLLLLVAGVSLSGISCSFSLHSVWLQMQSFQMVLYKNIEKGLKTNYIFINSSQVLVQVNKREVRQRKQSLAFHHPVPQLPKEGQQQHMLPPAQKGMP